MAGGGRIREPWWAVALAHFDGDVGRTAQALLDAMFPPHANPLPTLDGAERRELENTLQLDGGPLEADFSMYELLPALRRSPNSAPGPDGVSYKMLKAIPTEALQSLLGVC